MRIPSLQALLRRIEAIEEDLGRIDRREPAQDATWVVYVIRCEKSVFYVGRTANYNDRISRHLSQGGSKITKKYRPLKVLKLPRSFRSEFEAGKSERNIVDALRFAGVKAYGASLSTERLIPASSAARSSKRQSRMRSKV